MRCRKISMFMFVLGVLGLLAAGCAKEAEDDPCEGVTCSGHGTPRVVGDTCQCQCEEGYDVSDDGKSCVYQGEGPCQGQDCSGHGTCVEDGPDDAHCECNDGYMQDPQDDLACIEEACLETGVTCTTSDQCCQGFCLKYLGQEEGYCSLRDCTSDDECVDRSGDGNEMCCVDFGGENFICAKLGSGCTCGDQTGTCGDSCYCTSFSGCDPNYACLGSGPEDTNAVCTMPCTTDADCAECSNPEVPNQIFTCQPIYGGETYCLPEDEGDTCERSADCDGEEVCYPDVTSDLSAMIGTCGRLGAKDTGSACDSAENPNNLSYDERCADFYCMRDHCSEVCTLSTDCPESMVCGVQLFCLQEPCDVEANTGSIGMCVWLEGSLQDCKGNADCPDGETCTYYVTPQEELYKVCVTENCDPDGDACTLPGGLCGQGMDPCWGDLCLTGGGDGWCSALCETNEDCPDGMMCGGLSVSETLVTGACIEDNTCESGDDCDGEQVCMPFIGPDEQSLVGGCDDPAGDLPVGSECDDQANPNELPPAETCAAFYCIYGHCTEVCAADVNCPDSMVCGQITFGLPSGGSASIPMCQWMEGSLTACDGNGDCPDGEYCTFYVDMDDVIQKNCVTDNCDPAGESCQPPGSSPCGTGEDPCYGNLCLTTGTDSFCSAVCEIDEDCPQGMLCGQMQVADDQTTGVCIVDNTCESTDDCVNDTICIPFMGADEQSLVGGCADPAGDLALGAECDDQADPDTLPDAETCAGFYCINGHCTEVCASDANCVAGMVCSMVTFGLQSGGSAPIPMCLWMDGSMDACSIDGDCPTGEVCTVWADPDNVAHTTCITASCDLAESTCLDVGEEDCTADGNSCHNGLCFTAGYCSALCVDNGSCPTGMECQWVNFGADLYSPACVKGEAGVSPLCSICADSSQCPGDAECVESTANPGEMYCTLPCPTGDECPLGATCQDIGGGNMQCKPDNDTCEP